MDTFTYPDEQLVFAVVLKDLNASLIGDFCKWMTLITYDINLTHQI